MDIGYYLHSIYDCNPEMSQKIWQLVDKDGMVAKLNQTEGDWDAVAYVDNIYSAPYDMTKELCSLLDVKKVAANLNKPQDLEDIGHCLYTIHDNSPKIGQKLWELLKEKLAVKLSQTEDLWDAWSCIKKITSASRDMAKELCNLLTVSQVAENLNQSQELQAIGYYVYAIHGITPKISQKIWAILDKKRFATKLCRAEDLWDAVKCIKKITSASHDMAKELCDLLMVNRVAADLNQSQGLNVIGYYIYVVHGNNPKISQKLWGLCRETLAAKLSQTDDLWDAVKCIKKIISASRDMAEELFDLLSIEELAPILKKTRNIEGRKKYLAIIKNANKGVYQKLTKLLDNKNGGDSI